MPHNTKLRRLLLPPALAFAASALFVFFFQLPQPYGDSPEYFALASSVSQGHGFTADGMTPDTYRPPLFSFTLGLWFALFGGPGLVSAALFQSFIFALSALGVFLLGRQLLPGRYPYWAALAFAVHPFIIPFNAYVLQEPLLLCVTCYALYFSVKLLKEPSPRAAAASGVFWGLCILGKAVAWYAPFLLAVFVLRKSGKAALVVLGLALLAVLPWTVRNYRVLGRFVPVNDQGAGALEWYMTRGAHAGAGGAEYIESLKGKNMPEGEYRRKLAAFIASHPKQVFKQSVRNAALFTQVDREWYGKVAGLSMRWKYWLLPFLLFQLPLYIGFALALWRGRSAEIFFLGSFYLLYWLQYALYWGEPRFAIPVYPLLLCLGVLGWLKKTKESVHP